MAWRYSDDARLPGDTSTCLPKRGSASGYRHSTSGVVRSEIHSQVWFKALLSAPIAHLTGLNRVLRKGR
jgi:hypothetical protein